MTTGELNTELCRAIAQANADKVRKLIAAGAAVNAIGDRRTAPVVLVDKTPLWASVSLAADQVAETNIALFEALKESSLAKDEDDPRRKRRRYLKIIQLLISAGADIEKRCFGSTPLRVACVHNDLEVAGILLANGANPNADIFSPLSKHAKKAGRKITPGYYGTIIHEMVSKGYQGATAALIEAGADPNRVDHEGNTAFDIAAQKGGGPITKLLKRSRRL